MPPKKRFKCKYCGNNIAWGKEHMRFVFDDGFILITVCEECNNKIEEMRGVKKNET